MSFQHGVSTRVLIEPLIVMKAALKKEWDRLRACGDRGCWDEAHPREQRAVEREARDRGETAHFGRVFDICVEKNYHLPVGSPGRKSVSQKSDRSPG